MMRMIAGWTPCPLCCSPLSSSSAVLTSTNTTRILSEETIRALISSIPDTTTKSLKLFSHGRGLAAHLHAVHTPWKPGKAEIKLCKALQRRRQNENMRRCSLRGSATSNNEDADSDDQERCRKRQRLDHDDSTITLTTSWQPTEEEIKRWNEQVVDIVALTEVEAKRKKHPTTNTKIPIHTASMQRKCGRNGEEHQSYRDSLPPFIAAAANGDLNTLQQLVENNRNDEINNHIQSLLCLEDRNGSTAEHWAAGGGHIKCIQYLWELGDRIREEDKDEADNSSTNTNRDKKVRCRRRDGKTALHYASRNGKNEMIDLILAQKNAPSVNVVSGDGTTPLMMACYGGHVSTVKHLIQTHHADPLALNEWNCGTAHFAAMSLGKEGTDAVIELCKYLKHDCKVDFTWRQKQGHTPLHKAAQRKNRHVIEWLANETKSTTRDMEALGEPDDGGNLPSSLWMSMGGDKDFADWMKNTCKW